jgi:hypothetical protein
LLKKAHRKKLQRSLQSEEGKIAIGVLGINHSLLPAPINQEKMVMNSQSSTDKSISLAT